MSGFQALLWTLISRDEGWHYPSDSAYLDCLRMLQQATVKDEYPAERGGDEVE